MTELDPLIEGYLAYLSQVGRKAPRILEIGFGMGETTAAIARSRAFPLVLGFGSLAVAILAVEALIRIGAINRFIVPLPSQIVMAFERVVVEEDIAERFRLTFFEAFTAGYDTNSAVLFPETS